MVNNVPGFTPWPDTRPYSNVTPFTVRDGATHMLKIEEYLKWVRDTLLPHIDSEIGALAEGWTESADAMTAAWDTARDELLTVIADAEARISSDLSEAEAAKIAAEAAAEMAEAFSSTVPSVQDEAMRDIFLGEHGLFRSALMDAVEVMTDSRVDQTVPGAVAQALNDDAELRTTIETLAGQALESVAPVTVDNAGVMEPHGKRRLNESVSKSSVAQITDMAGLTPIENLLENGNFSDGLYGWRGSNGVATVPPGEPAKVVGTGNTSAFALAPTAENVFSAESGDVLYMFARVRVMDVGATGVGLILSSIHGDYRVNRDIVTDPVPGAYVWLSGRYVVSSQWAGVDLELRPTSYWGAPANAGGKAMQVSSVSAVNLTRIFGEGNEPSETALDGWRLSNSESAVSTVSAWNRSGVVGSRVTRSPGSNGVQFRFDDSYENIYTYVFPYMINKGMPFYVAACPGIVGHDFIAGRVGTVEQLKEMHDAGCEIGNHVSDHATISDPLFLEKVDGASELLVGAGIPYPETFTYPTGVRNAASDKEMFYRFAQAQLTSEPNTSAVAYDAPVFHQGWTVIDGTGTPERRAEQIERVKRYVSGSIANGLTPTLAFHNVLPPGEVPAIATQIGWEDFTAVVDWCYENGYGAILPRDLKRFNVLVDPGFNVYPVLGFSESAYPWAAAASSGVWERSTVGKYSGVACIRVSTSTAVTGTVSQGVALIPGKTYRVKMLANVSDVSSGSVSLTVRFRRMYGDTVGVEETVFEITSTTQGFELLEGQITVPSGVSNASVFIRASGFTGTAVVDNVSIVDSDLQDITA